MNAIRSLFFILALLLTGGIASAQQSSIIPKLGGSLFGNQEELLEPDEAFKLAVEVRDNNTIEAQFSPAPTYYLYRHRISFSVEKNSGFSIAGIELPPGEPKNDAVFGETRVFHQPFLAVVTLKREAGASNKIKLKA